MGDEPAQRFRLRLAREHELRRLRMRREVAGHDPHLVHCVRRHVGTQLAGPACAGERGERAALQLIRIGRQHSPVDEAAARQPERVERPIGWMRRKHKTRLRVGRLEHPAQPPEDRFERSQTPAQRKRALVALRGGRLAHLRLDVFQQAVRAVTVDEQPQRFVQPATVEIRIQVPQARRQATSHLSVGGRMLPAGQASPAVPQAEQRVELLDQFERQSPSPQRADGDRVARRGIGRNLEDRK